MAQLSGPHGCFRPSARFESGSLGSCSVRGGSSCSALRRWDSDKTTLDFEFCGSSSSRSQAEEEGALVPQRGLAGSPAPRTRPFPVRGNLYCTRVSTCIWSTKQYKYSLCRMFNLRIIYILLLDYTSWCINVMMTVIWHLIKIKLTS